MTQNPFFSKDINLKRILKTLAITILCTIIILYLGIYYFNTNEQESPIFEQGSVKEIKNELLTLIPEKYEIIERNCADKILGPLRGICNEWYEIYPKQYTDIEMEYLNKASLHYFNDIINVSIAGQVGDVIYGNEYNRWVYRETDREDVYLEIKEYGNTLVSYITLGGSHAFYDYYIMDDGNEVVILSIPSWNRIRCDTLEDGIEKEECENYLSSLWDVSDYPDSVHENFYDEYYNDLL